MTRIPFILLSTTDGSPLTGATPIVTISKDGAAFTSATNTPAEISNGYYYVDLTTAETTVTNNVIVRATATGAQPTAVVWDPEPTIPSAADNATAVWGAQTKEVTIATAQADTFATASSVANITTVAGAIKAKTDNLPQTPAAVGDAMTLTEATVTAIRNGLATITATDALAHGLDTLSDWGDAHWSTANVSGLATLGSIENLATYGDAHWSTADVSGLAEKTDIPTDYAKPTDIPTSDIAAIKNKVDSLHNTDLSGVATELSVEKIHAGLFNWSLDEDVINAKNTSGTVIVSSTITRDSSGNITAMEEGND